MTGGAKRQCGAGVRVKHMMRLECVATACDSAYAGEEDVTYTEI